MTALYIPFAYATWGCGSHRGSVFSSTRAIQPLTADGVRMDVEIQIKKPLQLTPLRNHSRKSDAPMGARVMCNGFQSAGFLRSNGLDCTRISGRVNWCPVKDSNLQLSVSKTAVSTNFTNWAWWGWMYLNQLCPKTNRFTVCRASPSAPHPHVRGSISFGLGGRI